MAAAGAGGAQSARRSRRGAAPFARVLAEMFTGDARAASIVLPTRPLDAMYAEPARALIRGARRGGSNRRDRDDSSVRRPRGRRRRRRRTLGAASGHCRGAVVRVSGSCSRGRPMPWPTSSNAPERMSSSPIATVNLWFDRPVLDEPFVGLPGRAMQWVFDKRTVFGDAASHLSLVSSGADAIVRLPNDQLIALAHGELLEALRAGASRPSPALDGRSRAAGDVFAGARAACPAHRREPPSAASFSPAIGLIPACPRPSRAPSAPDTEPRTRRSANLVIWSSSYLVNDWFNDSIR